ncbi:MAG: hypothetical protein MI922_28765 [Bacteroidales bacterium]|nr:hypothetical protein [Bacteroidales bacterium]
MKPQIIHTLVIGIIFLLLFISTEILHRLLRVKAEYTRKFVHLCTGIIVLFFPKYIQSHWLVLLLSSSFLLLLYLSSKYQFLPSINKVERKTFGSVLYPVMVYVSFIAYTYYQREVIYYIPLLILAICDPVACLIGSHTSKGKFTIFGKQKTFLASVIFAVLASVIVLFVLFVFDFQVSYPILAVCSISIVTTIAEAITHKGFDNLTIPVTAIFMLALNIELAYVL